MLGALLVSHPFPDGRSIARGAECPLLGSCALPLRNAGEVVHHCRRNLRGIVVRRCRGRCLPYLTRTQGIDLLRLHLLRLHLLRLHLLRLLVQLLLGRRIGSWSGCFSD